MSSHKRIVICGGGAIGAAIAYFTSRRGARPILIERHEVAGAASGKSGGFLGYRRLTTYAGYAAENNAGRGPGGRTGATSQQFSPDRSDRLSRGLAFR
jgi:glycine/D-amino acid oxidase-like deaminating enzyme